MLGRIIKTVANEFLRNRQARALAKACEVVSNGRAAALQPVVGTVSSHLRRRERQRGSAGGRCGLRAMRS